MPFPAVILSSPHHVGLSITRSLGRIGVNVYNVDATNWSPAFFSRYCEGKFVWDFESSSAGQSMEFLAGLADRIGGRAVLIPTTDTTAVFIADHKDALRGGYIFAEQESLLVRSLCNKSEMHNLARRAGVAVPETTVPHSRADLRACFRGTRFPFIVKLIDTRFRKRRSRTKALVRDRVAAEALYEQIPDDAIGSVLVQDWIPTGPDTDWMFNGYFDDRSNCLAGFTGKKLRQYPQDIGVTSLGICEQNQFLTKIAIGFLSSLHYRGPVDMDFRYDKRDGQYKLVDVNPRVGGSFRLFASEDDLDIVRVLYLHQTGQGVPSLRLAEGRKWAVEDYDVATAFQGLVEGRLNLRQWLRSLLGIEELGFLAVDDPMPALLMLRDDVAEAWRILGGTRNTPAPFESSAPSEMSEVSFSNSSASQGEL